jgi:peptide/nickel transport system permease protein
MIRIVPGDAALLIVASSGQRDPELVEAQRRILGLDRPYIVQYADWLWQIVRHGDLGRSFWTGEPVLAQILERLPVTFELAVGTIVLAQIMGIPTGIISAVRRDTGLDFVARLAGIAGLAIPGFWIGTMLIIIPALVFQYARPPGYVPLWVDPWVNLQQFILPCFAMGLADAARSMRMTRSQLLEVVRQDYIRTARAKGLGDTAVISRHALRNALVPVVSIVGIDFGYLLGRTVVMETVFSLPGLGSLTLSAILHRDYTQILGNILVIATMFLIVNLIVDLIYAWLDPRIRYSS